MIGRQDEKPRKAKSQPGAVRQERVRNDEGKCHHDFDTRIQVMQYAVAAVITVENAVVHLQAFALRRKRATRNTRPSTTRTPTAPAAIVERGVSPRNGMV